MDAGQEEYIRQVLEAYRKTPGTMGTVRRADRRLAMQLYQRGVSAGVIENAFVLAAMRSGGGQATSRGGVRGGGEKKGFRGGGGGALRGAPPRPRRWARFARWHISCR